jgi:hypothetical protein
MRAHVRELLAAADGRPRWGAAGTSLSTPRLTGHLGRHPVCLGPLKSSAFNSRARLQSLGPWLF